MVNYPTFLCPGEDRELFVSIDKNGSIDTKPDRGFIVKLTDTDGDGKAGHPDGIRQSSPARAGSPTTASGFTACTRPP